MKSSLAEMGSLSSKNKNVKYWLCFIDFLAEYAWVKLWEEKKGKTILNVFIKIVNESNRKANKLSFDQRRELYSKIMQEWLDNYDILMYFTNNGSKSVRAERFIKTLKTKTYKKWQLMIPNLILVIWINQ